MQQMILQPQAEGNGCIKSRCGSHCKKRFDFGKRLAHLENAQQSHRTDQQEQQCICLCLFTGQTEQAHDMKQQVKQEADTNGNGIRGGSPNRLRQKAEYSVLMKKTPADRVTLCTTRRPSSRTSFSTAKSESSSTSCAVCRAASLPCPTEMLQSASFSASRSFTPSPVMATVCFCRWNACISCRFCCGVTLPKTVYCCAAASISDSSMTRISTQRSP